jgi:hypothetical protein
VAQADPLICNISDTAFLAAVCRARETERQDALVRDPLRAVSPASGGGTAVLAETDRAYNPDKRTWSFQATTHPSPMIGRRNGEWDAGITRTQDGQIFDEVTKGPTITRARFYNLKRDSFSCVFETSNDSRKTWFNPIDNEAVRAQD